MKMGLVEGIERASAERNGHGYKPVWGSCGTNVGSVGSGRLHVSEDNSRCGTAGSVGRGHVTRPISRNRRRIRPNQLWSVVILVTDVSQLQGVVTIMDSSTRDPLPSRIHTAPSLPSVPRRGRVDNKTCPTCGRIFAKPAHLLRHVSTHVGGRPFPCTSCKRAFSRADALARHERTVHRDNDGGGGGGAGGGDRRRYQSGQSDEISLVVPPSDQSDGLLMQGTSAQVSPTNSLDQDAFDDYGVAGGTDETSGSMVAVAASAAAAARPPDLATTAQRSTSPSELGLHSPSSPMASSSHAFASQEWTGPSREPLPSLDGHAFGSHFNGLAGSGVTAAPIAPIAPISTSAAASPFSTLVGLIYEVDNAYDGHINTFLGSWLHHDGVPIIDPMAGE
jgi:hypothetical protein